MLSILLVLVIFRKSLLQNKFLFYELKGRMGARVTSRAEEELEGGGGGVMAGSIKRHQSISKRRRRKKEKRRFLLIRMLT